MPGEGNTAEDAAQRDGNVDATAGVNQPAGGIGNTLTVGTEKPVDYRLAIQLERERRETKRIEFELAREQRERECEIERARAQFANNANTLTADVRGNGATPSEIQHFKSLLPTISDSDVLTFLLSFERVCELNNIPRDLWSRLLTPQLTSQATKVILRLTNEEAKSYDSMKRAILSYYRLSAQRYLKEFRSTKSSGRDTYAMTLNKLRDMQMACFEARQIRTFEDLSAAFLMEQLTNTLPNDVVSFVWSKEPKTSQDCAREADLFRCEQG